MAKIVLIIAAIAELIRGLLCFFSSKPLANFLGLEYTPETLVFAYPLGAALLTFVVMFFIASKDPVKYKVIINMGALFYALGSISLIITYIRLGSFPVFWWIMLVFSIILYILFAISCPKKKSESG